MLKGFIKVYKDIIVPTDDDRDLKYKVAPFKGKVGIVTGGGSGHKPAVFFAPCSYSPLFSALSDHIYSRIFNITQLGE